MRTELHHKLFANVLLSTKSEPLAFNQFRHSMNHPSGALYIGASCAAVIAFIALLISQWN